MYASFNSSSNPFSMHNLSTKVSFSSDKRALNLNSLNNQLINSFIQQQQQQQQQQTAYNKSSTSSSSSQKQPMPAQQFIQGFPVNSQANLFPTSYFSLGQQPQQAGGYNSFNNNKMPVPPYQPHQAALLAAPHRPHPLGQYQHHSAASFLLSQLGHGDPATAANLSNNFYLGECPPGGQESLKVEHSQVPGAEPDQTHKIVNKSLRKFQSRDSEFYFDSGSSTGPISSSSSTNNDSLSSNVSSSESDCESKPASSKQQQQQQQQQPPSSSSSINGEDMESSNSLLKSNDSQQRFKRKPYRASNSINLNDITIRSNAAASKKAPNYIQHKKSFGKQNSFTAAPPNRFLNKNEANPESKIEMNEYPVLETNNTNNINDSFNSVEDKVVSKSSQENLLLNSSATNNSPNDSKSSSSTISTKKSYASIASCPNMSTALTPPATTNTNTTPDVNNENINNSKSLNSSISHGACESSEQNQQQVNRPAQKPFTHFGNNRANPLRKNTSQQYYNNYNNSSNNSYHHNSNRTFHNTNLMKKNTFKSNSNESIETFSNAATAAAAANKKQ